MDAVEREDDHHEKIRDEHRDVESVPAVHAAEAVYLRGVVRAPVVAEAVRVGEGKGELLCGVNQCATPRLACSE